MVKILTHLSPCSHEDQAAGVPADGIINTVGPKNAQKG